MHPRTPNGTREPRRGAARGAVRAGIPRYALVACGPWGGRIDAARATAAVCRGFVEGGVSGCDECPLELCVGGGGGEAIDARALLDALDFDARMRRARAVVLGAMALHASQLVDSVAFEIATRARQGGVPAYALARESSLDAFDARLLDLQVIVIARGERGLLAAGRRLAAIV